MVAPVRIECVEPVKVERRLAGLKRAAPPGSHGEIIDLAAARKRKSTVLPEKKKPEIVEVRIDEKRALGEKERAFEALRERERALTYHDFESALRRGTAVWCLYSPASSHSTKPLITANLLNRLKLEFSAPAIIILYQLGKASLSASATLPTLQAIVLTVSEALSLQPAEKARSETLAALTANDSIAFLISDLVSSASQLVHQIERIELNARQELAARIALARKRAEAILEQMAFEQYLAAKQAA